jgi:hypothetical protein
MRKTDLTAVALCEAVREMTQGLIDADLGGGLVKKRVGMAGRGKRSGARTLGSPQTKTTDGFLFSDLRKTSVPILMPTS